MTLRQFYPCQQLSGYISKYWIVESGSGMQNLLLPDTAVAMAFRLKGRTGLVIEKDVNPLSFSTVSGLRNTPRKVSYDRNSEMLIVLFKATGISSFLPVAPHETFGETVDLRELVGQDAISRVEDLLLSTTDDHLRITLIDKFLLSLVKPKSDRMVLAAVRQIVDTKGAVRI